MRFYLLIALALAMLLQLVALNASALEASHSPLHAIAQRDVSHGVGVAGSPPSGQPPHGGPPPPRTTVAASSG